MVDALRGFAIVSIMLLHNIEHFTIFYAVEGIPVWMVGLDRFLEKASFLLFGGKSYAIFSLLFGVTFYLQMHGRALRGEDFRARFAWRMLLLFAFGMVNSAMYDGDILSIYAVLGLTLLPVARLSNRSLILIAVLLSMQPWQLMLAWEALGQASFKLPTAQAWPYYELNMQTLRNGGMLDAWWGNLTNGKMATIIWCWNNGRIFQIPALFMMGMVLARGDRFAVNDANRRFWRRLGLIALTVLVPLILVKHQLAGWIANEALRRPVETVVQAWIDLAAMPVLVTVFVLVYHAQLIKGFFKLLSPLGRMSLTSYMMQSVAGTFIYHGFGLGMYRYTGATYCLMIGFALAGLQIAFSIWWLKSHKQGPLESLWHRLTWIGTKPVLPQGAGVAK
jgi:uncharacterized protein